MQLVLLNVSNNKLSSLPESVGSCYSLEELQANGNFKFVFLIIPQNTGLVISRYDLTTAILLSIFST